MFFAAEHGLQVWGVNIAVRSVPPTFHIPDLYPYQLCEDSYPLHYYLSLGAHRLSTQKAH